MPDIFFEQLSDSTGDRENSGNADSIVHGAREGTALEERGERGYTRCDRARTVRLLQTRVGERKKEARDTNFIKRKINIM